MGFVLFYIPGVAYRRTAQRHFSLRFPDRSGDLWDSSRAWQSRLAPSRPRHSASVNLMMRHMEWGCALYRALQDDGVDRAEAGSLVESIMSDVYRPVPSVLYKISRLRSSRHATRVEWLLLRVISRRVFSAPFVHRYLDSDDGVAWDVTCCPFADYFVEQGVPELTPHAACNLDHRAAEAIGVELVRTQTIAEGAEHCDFRWKIPA
ncbi:MAG: L-2-amino-thiazoline-4-carboxylic acid hydrolase [Ilumatobacter sp.]|uniref:L-2-amino-thiazoline-4-carboxylic acid hydrolase n=1 Tax=Ilumatobacter sp. TaxID=1967498 RepID=UPI00262A97B6|nr:L-2-amino-thiazoline-4-carboxylic acid hydrolase [Ilumatobacter sp.]MDJ0769647.1 L-2-amino-thiazoline-4-carboxylic acid hydrolase [Ilumatobacter sp.]